MEYYDNTTYYSDHSTFCIIVNHNDRSYQYSDYRVDSWAEGNWDTISETELRAALDGLGIPVPAAAQFLDEGEGNTPFSPPMWRRTACSTMARWSAGSPRAAHFTK